MGRSEQKQVNQEATGLFNTEQANAAQAQSTLMPAYKSLLAHPGYTDPQKAAITRASEGGVGAAFGDAEQGAVNRAARTNNAAGLTSTEDALARQRMITSGNLAAGNEANFANTARSDRNVALGGIGSLFGQNLQGANATLGHQTQNAQAPGFWDQLALATMNAAGQVGAAAVPCWIAAETYDGWDDPRTIAVRLWLTTEFVKRPIGRLVMAVYMAIGPQVAWLVKHSSLLRGAFRKLFDRVLVKANG